METTVNRARTKRQHDQASKQSLQLLQATTYKASNSQAKSSRNGSTGFPDGATHLDIELSCYEDHPSSLSFLGNQTVAQAQADIRQMRERLHGDLVESWLEQTTPEPGNQSILDGLDSYPDKLPSTQPNVSQAFMSSEKRKTPPALKPRTGGIRRRSGGKRHGKLSPILSMSCESSPRPGVPKRPSSGSPHGAGIQFHPSNALLLHFGDERDNCSTWTDDLARSPSRYTKRHAINGTMPSHQEHSWTLPYPQYELDMEMARQPPTVAHDGSQKIRFWAGTSSIFFTFFNTCGMAMTYGIFLAYYSRVLLQDQPTAKIALVGSMQSFLLFALAMPISAAARMGCQRLALGVGSVLFVVVMICLSFCEKWASIFVTQGIVLGLASGTVLHSRIAIIEQALRADKQLTTIVAICGSCIGGIVYILMFQQLIDTVGLGWTFRCMAFVSAITLIPTNLFLRPQGVASEAERGDGNHGSTDPSVWIQLSGAFSSLWGLGAGLKYVPLFALEKLQASFDDACSMLITLYTACFFSYIVCSYMVHRHSGVHVTSVASCFLSGATMFWWIAVDSGSAAYVFCVLLGVFSGGIAYSFNDSKQTNRIQQSYNMPQSSGAKWPLLGVALLTGGPICGALVDASRGSFLPVQIFAGCALVAGGILSGISICLQQG